MHQRGNVEIEVVTENFARARSNVDYRNINIREQTIVLASDVYDDGYFCVDGLWKISKTNVNYGTAKYFEYQGGEASNLFAGQSVAGLVRCGDNEN